MNLLRRRSASLNLLAERDFRNYFIADAMFDFAEKVKVIGVERRDVSEDIGQIIFFLYTIIRLRKIIIKISNI